MLQETIYTRITEEIMFFWFIKLADTTKWIKNNN